MQSFTIQYTETIFLSRIILLYDRYETHFVIDVIVVSFSLR